MAILTLEQLTESGVWAHQRQLFERLFGDAVDVNPLLCIEVATQFDWELFAYLFLSTSRLMQYTSVRTPEWTRYRSSREALSASYVPNGPTSYNQYWAARKSLLDQYDTACAALFGELYDTQGE